MYSIVRPFRWVWIALAVMFVLIGAAVLVSVIYGIRNPAQPQTFPGFGFWWFGPFSWFGFIFVFLILFGVLRWIFWPWRGGWYYRRNYDPAMEALRERYAKGEISKEQFEQMVQDLQHR